MENKNFKFSNKIIFIFSPEKWSNMRLSKHHYALELVKLGNKVYFLEPAQIDAKDIIVKEIISDSLWVMNYPLIARGQNKIPSIIYNWLAHKEIKKIINKVKVIPDVVWCFDPIRANRVMFFKDSIKILHLVDFCTENYYSKVGKYFDIAFSAMQKQVSILNEYGYTAFFINHGLSNSFVHYSKERLERIAQPLYNPVQIHKMNVGYAGNLLSEPPNRNIMREVIEQNPGVTFHFWGQYEKNTIDNIGPAYFNPEFVTYLQTKSNVTLYGIVDTETLASQMQKMDMFWVCWKTADGSMWNADTNPHKIIEYLSTGKPVVSHYMSNYENYDILYMPPKNNTGYELLFNDVINKVKAGEPEELIKKRLFFALDNSYQNQLKLIEDKVNALQ